MSTSEQLEREAEQTRAEISATLDELRARMTPGEMVDQLVDYANDSTGGMFFRSLRQQVVSNPLPVALMGVGLAWFGMANKRAPMRRDGLEGGPNSTIKDKLAKANTEAANSARRAGETIREKAEHWSDQAQSAASDVQDAARSGMAAGVDTASQIYDEAAERMESGVSRLRSAAQGATDSVSQTASEMSSAAAERVRRAGDKIGQSASNMRDNLAGAGSNLKHLVNDQPLVLVGIGLAVGALIGIALPSTAAEDKLMGEESDALKRKSTEFGEEQLDKGKTVAERAWQSAKQASKEQGLVSDAEEKPPSAREGSDEASLVPSANETENQKHEHSER